MTPDEITQAQAAVREFGYDVHEHCLNTSARLLGLGMYQEAAEVAESSRVLIDLLKAISGKDFLQP